MSAHRILETAANGCAFDVVKLVRDANEMVSSTSAVSPTVMIDNKSNPEVDG